MGEALYKEAVQALEALATRDSDPRSRKACAWPLAALCHRLRHQQAAPEEAAAADGGVGGAPGPAPLGAKGLAELPADGALRLLLGALLEGRWEEGGQVFDCSRKQRHLLSEPHALPCLTWRCCCRGPLPQARTGAPVPPPDGRGGGFRPAVPGGRGAPASPGLFGALPAPAAGAPRLCRRAVGLRSVCGGARCARSGVPPG